MYVHRACQISKPSYASLSVPVPDQMPGPSSKVQTNHNKKTSRAFSASAPAPATAAVASWAIDHRTGTDAVPPSPRSTLFCLFLLGFLPKSQKTVGAELSCKTVPIVAIVFSVPHTHISRPQQRPEANRSAAFHRHSSTIRSSAV
jgi:hypothetical protein